MRKLKILFLLILTSLTLGVGINGVKAAYAVGDKYTFHWESGNDLTAGLGIKAGNQAYSVWNYYGTSGNKEIKMYCVDPADYNNKNGVTVTVTNVYNFNDTKISLNTRALYYGLYTILANGGKTRHDSKSLITATDMAVRAYFNVIMGLNDNNYGGDNKMKAAKYSVLNLGYAVAQEKTDKLSALGVTVSKPSNGSSFSGGSVTDQAKNLIRMGIDAAYEYKNSDGISNNTEVGINVTNGQAADRNHEEKIVNFKITKDEDGYVKIGRSDIVCNNCEKNGVAIEKVEYSENGEWKELTSRIDISKFMDENGNVKLKITLSKNETESESCDANIVLNYYVPEVDDVSIALLDDKSSSSTQRYLGVVPNNYVAGNNDNNDKQLQYTINGIACLGLSCETTLETPVCSEEEDGKASITAPTDIKKCVINNKDDAGNSYKLEENLGGVNNEYCGTFCKEDYREISLNKALDKINCGGYFKLKSTIKGSMDCYRGSANTADKSIDQEKYINDIIDAQKAFIDAYNDYLEATAASNGEVDESCAEYPTIKIKDENGVEKEVEDTTGSCLKWEYSTSGTYSGIQTADSNRTTGYVSTEPAAGSFSYGPADSKEDLADEIDSDIESAKSDLDSAKTKYENIIKNYNSCTKDWTNDFNFDPKIYWEYDQQYYDMVSDEDKYLVPVDDITIDQKIQACEGNVNNQFGDNDCSTGWTSIDTMFADFKYTTCTTSGCTTDTQQVSKAKFIKQHFDVEQEYITPTVFYQVSSSGPASGGITTNKDYTGPGVQLSPVGDYPTYGGLPLSIDAYGGGLFKMHIEDLGEFYNTAALGRLVDFSGDQENSSVAKALGVSEGSWDGNYICHYYTTCVPNENECPSCDFECKGEYCYWKKCPDCGIECVNCIYNLGDLQFNVKPVSPTNFASVDREYGYNWNINSTLASLSLIREKAEETITNIEEANTTIYNDSEDNPHLELSVELNPNTTNFVLDYNKEVESQKVGGYNNITTECYDYEDSEHRVHENVFCFSTFIDELIDKTDAVQHIKSGRVPAGKRSNENVQSSTYWEPWTEYRYDENVIGGPSYK